MSNYKTYREKLLDPRWQKRRLEIFHRDNFTCKDCGSSKKTLHVHHHWYESQKDPWDYPDACLVTLCFECHEFQESHKGDGAFCIAHLNASGILNSGLAEFGNIIRELSKVLPVERIEMLLLHMSRNERFLKQVIELYENESTRDCEFVELPF